MSAEQPGVIGLHRSMPAETYHATMAMSAGGLKRMKRSPAHFYGLQLDPNRPQGGEPTPAMRAGTLAHMMLLEPSEIDSHYIVRPEWSDGRTKDGKAWLASVSPGLVAVTEAEMATANAQAAAVLRLPEVASLMESGEAETSAFWIDEQTGELCKCRPDWTSPAGGGVILFDLKTCQDASPAGFSRAISHWDYHLQAAWYSDGYTLTTGKEVLGFVFGAVESAWPHAAAAYMLDDAALDKARIENRRLLDLYAECKRTGHWAGYQSAIQAISLPPWAT